MIDRERLEQIVRDELARCEDEEAARAARQRTDDEAEADRLLRHARERRGTPLPRDGEG